MKTALIFWGPWVTNPDVGSFWFCQLVLRVTRKRPRVKIWMGSFVYFCQDHLTKTSWPRATGRTGRNQCVLLLEKSINVFIIFSESEWTNKLSSTKLHGEISEKIQQKQKFENSPAIKISSPWEQASFTDCCVRPWSANVVCKNHLGKTQCGVSIVRCQGCKWDISIWCLWEHDQFLVHVCKCIKSSTA